MSQYTVEKLLDLGAKPVSFSDSNGVVYDPDGIDREKLAYLMELKNVAPWTRPANTRTSTRKRSSSPPT